MDTLAENWWSEGDSREPFELAEYEGQEPLVTIGESFRHQKNLAGRRIGIVDSYSASRLEDGLRGHDVERATTTVQPGMANEVRIRLG